MFRVSTAKNASYKKNILKALFLLLFLVVSRVGWCKFILQYTWHIFLHPGLHMVTQLRLVSTYSNCRTKSMQLLRLTLNLTDTVSHFSLCRRHKSTGVQRYVQILCWCYFLHIWKLLTGVRIHFSNLEGPMCYDATCLQPENMFGASRRSPSLRANTDSLLALASSLTNQARSSSAHSAPQSPVFISWVIGGVRPCRDGSGSR